METTLLSLSILIPTYNDICVSLVTDLHRQCLAIPKMEFEILVGDDGSISEQVLAGNRAINTLPHCRYIERGRNAGRAAIRNFLAREAQYDFLLYVDTNKEIVRTDYVHVYLSTIPKADVICGGQVIMSDQPHDKGNLRLKYEKAYQRRASARQRQEKAYSNFNTSNFCIRRELMLAHPFDERFKRYGYEDVLFGKELKASHKEILHIDNPVGFCRFESNERYMAKTEEALQTLYDFRDDLHGYSKILLWAGKVSKLHLTGILSLCHRLLGNTMRCNLTGKHPSLLIFNLYRLSRFVSLSPL